LEAINSPDALNTGYIVKRVAIIFSITTWFFLGGVLSAHASDYEVTVTRIDQDLYKTTDGIYIKTQYCYVYAYGVDAILVYQPYSYANKIIFTDQSQSCSVTGLFK
jgi:hypothetical protein